MYSAGQGEGGECNGESFSRRHMEGEGRRVRREMCDDAGCCEAARAAGPRDLFYPSLKGAGR